MIRRILNLFQKSKPILNLVKEKPEYFYGMKFPLSTMNGFVECGLAIDATFGGLVIGRSHEEGGILIWVKRDTHYVLEAEMEGYEFILNAGANYYFSKSMKTFHKYELHKTTTFEEYVPNDKITVLDTRTNDEPKYLLFESGGFAVINKYSTKGFLESLNKMNNSIAFEKIDDLTIKTAKLAYENIEVKFYNEIIGYFPAPTIDKEE